MKLFGGWLPFLGFYPVYDGDTRVGTALVLSWFMRGAYASWDDEKFTVGWVAVR